MRIIAHFDMDAFFAACEERYNPQFRGKPIVVGADPKGGKGRGVVSTASYAARRYGIHSALPITQAWRLAEAAKAKGEPEAIFLTGNFRLYSEVSNRIMRLLEQYADFEEQARPPKFPKRKFERASVDEAYLDISSCGSYQAAEKLVCRAKREIKKQEGLTVSAGIAPNKLVAKIASDFQKPDGLTIVRPEQVEGYLAPLPIRVIPGIGPKTGSLLQQRGVKIVGDLQKLSKDELVRSFGKWGDDLARKSFGVSESEVSGEWEAKSVGEEETFEIDTLDPGFILDRMRELCRTVFRRFQRDGAQSFRTVAIKIRFADFTTSTRAHSIKQPLNTEAVLTSEALRLILPFLDRRENPKRKKMRLIGVRVEKLTRQHRD